MHNGKKLTPKNVLLPLQIKLLTNNTELITAVSRLGHGISHPKLLGITTEIAYSIINKCFSRKLEADKVIETTINADTKTPGGTAGKYFPNPYRVKRYKLIFFHQHFVLIFGGKKGVVSFTDPFTLSR